MANFLKIATSIALSSVLIAGCQPSTPAAEPMPAIQLSQHIADSDVVVIDIRNDEYFNGWPVKKGIKQGHIEGAVNFQPHLLNLASDKESQLALLKTKGITPDKTLIVYCNTGAKSAEFYHTLKQLGFTNLYNLDGGLAAWGEAGFDTVTLPKYSKLVYPQWLNQLIKDEHPTTLTNKKHVLLEVGQDMENAYRSGHISGAVYLDTGKIDWNQGGTPSWNFVPDQQLAQIFTDYGIDQDTTVIVYADKLAMGAYRAAVAMLYSGVKDVRVLNGGKQAWRDAGFSLEQKAHSPQPLSSIDLQVPAHKDWVINIPEAKALLKKPDGILASIMSETEFYGKKSGYSYYDKAGHIPGAVLLANGKTPYDMLNYEDRDGTMRAYNEIEALWRDAGVTSDKQVSFYCGTGWRASEAFFAAYLMGWENISVFDDGWVGWSMNPENPTANTSSI